jgi:hypothetical protein
MVGEIVTDNLRLCGIYGSPLTGKRSDKRYCGSKCRVVAHRCEKQGMLLWKMSKRVGKMTRLENAEYWGVNKYFFLDRSLGLCELSELVKLIKSELAEMLKLAKRYANKGALRIEAAMVGTNQDTKQRNVCY